MKTIKIGIFGLMIMLMSSVMTTRVEAASSDGYDYYRGGSATSTNAAKDHGTTLDDSKLLDYRVEEADKNGIKYFTMKDYMSSSKSYYTIPGLNNTNVLGEDCSTMVPQGICRMDDNILITAYDSAEEKKSVIYVLNENSKLEATLVYCNKAHLGGITYDGKYVWIAEGSGADEGKNYVGAISKDTMTRAVNVSKNKSAKSVALNNDKHIKRQKVSGLASTSYCTYFDNRLWVGTFDDDSVSKIYGYKVDYTYSKPKLNVDRYIEAPKKTQGICFYKAYGTVYLGVSTSYGRDNDSVIRCYKPSYYNTKMYYDPEYEKKIAQIFKNDAYRTLTIPSMSEQVSVYGASMYCIFESAAYKYLNQHDNFWEKTFHNNHSERPIGSFCIFSVDKIFK